MGITYGSLATVCGKYVLLPSLLQVRAQDRHIVLLSERRRTDASDASDAAADADRTELRRDERRAAASVSVTVNQPYVSTGPELMDIFI